MTDHGPRWLGIGAQRSGTSWFADLLTQHPMVNVAEGSGKEQHELYRDLFGGWSESERKKYLSRFSESSTLLGEFTPYYLRALWVPPVVAELLDPKTPILVILRNPIERFASALRHELSSQRAEPRNRRWIRRVGSDAQWGGMYATQLDAWAGSLGRERLVVLQYEKVQADPQGHLELVWERLGLQSVPLQDVKTPSETTTDRALFEVDMVPGLSQLLAAAYRPEIERLVAYDIDPALWPIEAGS